MEKGYSQIDWMRLAKAQPHLGGDAAIHAKAVLVLAYVTLLEHQ